MNNENHDERRRLQDALAQATADYEKAHAECDCAYQRIIHAMLELGKFRRANFDWGE